MEPTSLEALRAHMHGLFADDPGRKAAVSHFVEMLRVGLEGLAAMGMVLHVHAEGVDQDVSPVPPLTPPAMASIEDAIKHMGG